MKSIHIKDLKAGMIVINFGIVENICIYSNSVIVSFQSYSFLTNPFTITFSKSISLYILTN